MILKRIFNALLASFDHFATLAVETDGKLCEVGQEVRAAFLEVRDMDKDQVFGSLSKTAAASLREIANRMDKAKTAFEFANAAGDMAALNVQLLRVSADWAHSECRTQAA